MLNFLKKDLFSKNYSFDSFILVNLFINLNLLLLLNFYRNKSIISNQPFIRNIIEIVDSNNVLIIFPITSLIIMIFLVLIIYIINTLFEKNLNIVFFSTITVTLFYFLKINSISRILFILFLLINTIEFFLKKNKLYFFVFIKFIIIIFLISQLQLSNNQSDILEGSDDNIFSVIDAEIVNDDFDITFDEDHGETIFNIDDAQACINSFSSNEKNILNEYFIVGHAYGNPESAGQGLSEKVLNYFDKKEKNIILTGDILLNNNSKNLEVVRNQLSSRFNNFYVAVGNHDLSNEYYEIFEEDLYLISENSVDLIIANFSTYNWKPSIKDQVKINQFIENSNNKNVILFSHFLFWFHLVDNPVQPNGIDFLLEEPTDSHLDWLNIDNKNLIIISGDYGNRGRSFYCEYHENKNIIFVASGVSDSNNDKILKLEITENSFNFQILNLN